MDYNEKLKLVRDNLTMVGFPKLYDEVIDEIAHSGAPAPVSDKSVLKIPSLKYDICQNYYNFSQEASQIEIPFPHIHMDEISMAVYNTKDLGFSADDVINENNHIAEFDAQRLGINYDSSYGIKTFPQYSLIVDADEGLYNQDGAYTDLHKASLYLALLDNPELDSNQVYQSMWMTTSMHGVIAVWLYSQTSDFTKLDKKDQDILMKIIDDIWPTMLEAADAIHREDLDTAMRKMMEVTVYAKEHFTYLTGVDQYMDKIFPYDWVCYPEGNCAYYTQSLAFIKGTDIAILTAQVDNNGAPK